MPIKEVVTMNKRQRIANMGIDESKLPEDVQSTAWWNALTDQLRHYNEESKAYRNRLARIEDLLGKDGFPRLVEMMDECLPDGEWTDEDWNDALDKVSQDMYG